MQKLKILIISYLVILAIWVWEREAAARTAREAKAAPSAGARAHGSARPAEGAGGLEQAKSGVIRPEAERPAGEGD